MTEIENRIGMMKQKMRSLCLDIMIETSFSSVARLRLYSGAELKMFSQNAKKRGQNPACVDLFKD